MSGGGELSQYVWLLQPKIKSEDECMRIRTDSTTMDNTVVDCAASEGALVKNKSRRGKNDFNFWIDVLTFLISTISGLALMHSPDGHGLQDGAAKRGCTLGAFALA
jgi:hypothetical protein